MRVFIGHSSDDVDVATRLIELLEGALGLTRTDIRCSSVEDYRLPAGATTAETLRTEVHDAEVFIGVITPRSLESVYALFELGARWGTRKVLMPLLAGGVTPTTLKEPLSSINAVDGTKPGQIGRFVEDVAKHLSLEAPVQTPDSLISGLVNAASIRRSNHQPPEERTRQWSIGAALAIIAVTVGHFRPFPFEIKFIPEGDRTAMRFYGLVAAVAVVWYVTRQVQAIRAWRRRNPGPWAVIGMSAVASIPAILLAGLWAFMADFLTGRCK